MPLAYVRWNWFGLVLFHLPRHGFVHAMLDPFPFSTSNFPTGHPPHEDHDVVEPQAMPRIRRRGLERLLMLALCVEANRGESLPFGFSSEEAENRFGFGWMEAPFGWILTGRPTGKTNTVECSLIFWEPESRFRVCYWNFGGKRYVTTCLQLLNFGSFWLSKSSLPFGCVLKLNVERSDSESRR